ncbi:calcium-binding and coiled-coil domain-containing protein 1-like [Sardina pilchardus]|uniref:calcium-binding and coiled-coil domain-containing protein 1-like n=1 Tax=Sardina pilchardus TaxID=27697 RepID=UPI002E14B131
MDNIRKVHFRNVGKSYFPQTRVECHYKLTSDHTWDGHDWIGLFKMGWSTVKEYYTYVWALVPEGYIERRDTDCCVQFQTSYLPKPGADLYQFVYVDARGEVCGVSPPFLFATPGALDELVTLENERSGEEGAGEDLLMVVPKAQILQGHLEECQRELQELKLAVEESGKEKEQERERCDQDRQELTRERDEMKDEISELMEGLKHQREELEQIELKLKDAQSSQQNMSAELLDLLKERTEQQQQIRELADDNSVLTQQKKQAEAELERTKERVKKLTMQRKDEEEEKKTLKDESQAAQSEIRQLRERLEASERSTDVLRRELSELGSLQGHSHAELHQTRMQLAQVNLQLSQANLALREGEATWAQEKEQLRQSAELDQERIQKLSRELQRKEEWLQEERAERDKLEAELGGENYSNRAQLSDARKEVHELKASLKEAQKESKQQLLEKEVLLEQVRELEKRLDLEAETKWFEAASVAAAPQDITDVTPCEEEEEEKQKQKQEEEEEEEEVYETPEAPQAEADTCEDVAQTEPPVLAEPEDKPCRVVEINQLVPAHTAPEEDRECWEDSIPYIRYGELDNSYEENCSEENRSEENCSENCGERCAEERCAEFTFPTEPILSYLSEYPQW